ncbi:uncharacterized protein LOC121654625 [Melanotaenia boesemani]|uniref:uncharacterized protein LOC121654625 n=1 Tax=Melanotaenia boesemani TaxID=1250792 RepID=UPI001C046367|nr:uncharacterized protein LOC121654625 [Melanotaenia boesemani]
MNIEGPEQLDPDQPRAPGSGAAHGPADISRSRADGPKQPYLKVYPLTLYNDRRRGFNYKWFSTHKWLEYSQATNSTYFYACRDFSLPSSGDTVFTSEGFNNWKKAMFTDGGFATHAKSKSHCNAMFAWAEYKKTLESECSLPASMNTGYEKLVKENRECIKSVADSLLLIATQNIAQRGNNETEGHNKGNFLAIMEHLAKHDPKIKKKDD